MERNSKEYKLVVLGSGGVGKSALTIRLVTDNFLEDYDPTIEDSYRKLSTIDGDQVVLDILDTAGQEEYTSMQDQWMREGNGFLLVYSVTSQSSFDDIATFKDKILRAKDVDNVPIVLVGNKCDLHSQRQVSPEQGKQLAMRWGCYFMETSAKERINNEECFFQVVREIRKSERPARVEPPVTMDKTKKKKKKPLCTIL
ncbi:hypothetical protein P43SY_003216 [Pythium insidiosum]|uniref:Ras protein let-60 n=1 Tax=Pythium insidiosum TaxID=114742 RepID=A0AAD5LN02_PYTIN|nr:hypothetical protein P43SY_003216 [Pythium insidiosum]KAJ0409129.1 hypothetical protein ATCC90586_002840 [Pythium insidiosum]